MKGALSKKKLLEVVPLSWSTIDRLERDGAFPKRWYITDGKVAWTQEEVEKWLDDRRKNSPEEFQGKKPPVELRKYRQVKGASVSAAA
ncbi:helix-turn-helix transcriptional regulator [Citrobacter braakii]